MSKRIGILGYGGAAGDVVTNYLKSKYLLRCGQRTICEPVDESIEYRQIDIHNQEQLEDFCKNCVAVINCIGPSYLISEKIAITAQRSGAYYVDVFGVNLESKQKELAQTVVIMGAGSIPGLSGILPKWAKMRTDKPVKKVNIFAGGVENITVNACTDVLLSMRYDFGKANTYFKNGEMQKTTENRISAPICFAKNANVYEYFTNEVYASAKQADYEELHWYNIQLNSEYLHVMENTIKQLVSITDDKEVLSLARKARDKILETELVSDYWYKIWMDIDYDSVYKLSKESILIECTDTYIVTGVIAALCLEHILTHEIKNGIYWPFEILDSKEVMDKMVELSILKVNQSENVENLVSYIAEAEEGEL